MRNTVFPVGIQKIFQTLAGKFGALKAPGYAFLLSTRPETIGAGAAMRGQFVGQAAVAVLWIHGAVATKKTANTCQLFAVLHTLFFLVAL